MQSTAKNAHCAAVMPQYGTAQQAIFNKYEFLPEFQKAIKLCAATPYDCPQFADAFKFAKNDEVIDAKVCTAASTARYAKYLFCKACYSPSLSGSTQVGFRNGCIASNFEVPAYFKTYVSPCADALDKIMNTASKLPAATKFEWGF